VWDIGSSRDCRMWVRMRDLAVITEGSKSLERKRTRAKSETDAIKCLRQIYLQPSWATVNTHTHTQLITKMNRSQLKSIWLSASSSALTNLYRL